MVDLLGMFRRRPAKRGAQGSSRRRDDITAIDDPFNDTYQDDPLAALADSVRGQPTTRINPRSPQNTEQIQRKPRPSTSLVPKPRGNGSGGPQLLRRPGFLAVHSIEKSFGSRQVVRGVSIYVRRGEAVGLLGP